MERDIQARLCVATERMGTGLLRTGAALERIATVMEKQSHPTPKGVEVGRCGNLAPAFVGAPSELCRLSHGHGGWHKGDGGAEWNDPRPESVTAPLSAASDVPAAGD